MATLTEPPAQDRRPRGRPRKTEDERDDGNRRHALLEGAARLFRNQGFDATTTRDIAAAVGMHSGSPFYHFNSKNALLYAVMEEGMRSALARQSKALVAMHSPGDAAALSAETPAALLDKMRHLVRAHFDVLLGPDNDFIPVMLYEARALNPTQRSALAQLQSDYEAAWVPLLEALHATGQLRAPVGLARLLILGALNWSVQWFDPKKKASVEDLTHAAMCLFFQETT
jgi:AcrR family transcriptional regulator